MKTQMKPLLMALALLAVLSAPNVASAYYDPGIQRWINRDPLAEGGGVNLYTLAYNSPPNGYDTDGRGVKGTAIGAGIGGVFGGTVFGALGAAGGSFVAPVVGTIGGAEGLGSVGFAAGVALGGAIGNGIENLWCLLHRPHPLPTLPSSSSPTGPPPVAVPGAPPGTVWVPTGGLRNGVPIYKPSPPVPTATGSQPSASWDGVYPGHWDIDDGNGNGSWWDWRGNPIKPGQQHNPTKPGPPPGNPAPQ
jgi:hypothetical protein